MEGHVNGHLPYGVRALTRHDNAAQRVGALALTPTTETPKHPNDELQRNITHLFVTRQLPSEGTLPHTRRCCVRHQQTSRLMPTRAGAELARPYLAQFSSTAHLLRGLGQQGFKRQEDEAES